MGKGALKMIKESHLANKNHKMIISIKDLINLWNLQEQIKLKNKTISKLKILPMEKITNQIH